MMRMIIILVELIFHVYNLYFSENICMLTSTLSSPFLCIFLSETFARPPRHLPRHQFHFLTLQLQSRVEQPGGKFVHIICDVYLYSYSCLVFIHCHRQRHPELFDLHFRALLQFALCQNSKTSICFVSSKYLKYLPWEMFTASKYISSLCKISSLTAMWKSFVERWAIRTAQLRLEQEQEIVTFSSSNPTKANWRRPF